VSKKAPDAPVTEPQRRESSRIWVYFKAGCPACEWICADRRQLESDAWGDLAQHMRSEHGGSIREVRIRRTVIEEIAEPDEQI